MEQRFTMILHFLAYNQVRHTPVLLGFIRLSTAIIRKVVLMGSEARLEFTLQDLQQVVRLST